MSLQCAISGEALTSNTTDEVVVTPSGNLCLKRLLLAKLSENGGIDPFSDTGRSLSEDDMVTLQVSQKDRPNMPPPPATVSSFSGTLQQLAKEYDSVLLELFDTRKTLQETRRELSQALYQNDASIRVLARMSVERDAARQDAQRFQAAAAEAAPVNGTRPSAGEAGEAPSKKKPRLNEAADLPLSNDIPASDLDTMLGEWEKLHKARRAKAKTTFTLPTTWKVANSQSWHKSTCRGLTAISECQRRWFVTAGKDKMIMVYDSKEEVMGGMFSPKSLVSSMDVMPKFGGGGSGDALLVVAACDQELRLYDTSNPDAESVVKLGQETLVSVRGHPTSQHCMAATKGGKVMIFRVPGGQQQQQLLHVGTFTAADETEEFCCATVHPDGLLYATGTAKGLIHIWDLKNKQVGGTLSNEKEDAVLVIAFSSNGYHVASAHASGAVRIWDIRKNKFLAEVNVSGEQKLQSVEALAFHPGGKYLAYGGQGGLHITMVKDWKISASLDVKDVAGIVWDSQWIVTISDKKRDVTFHERGE